MFQPQPAAAQRRHRRLPSGTMVSYAEVKSYLSKREIPQLFESLMAGLMYHRPENHIGYLQTCLDEVKSNSEAKVHWSTFVNRKRKSKEILPPLTPKKQESVSSWSDNSRQSTPLPPISARTRTRTSEQQDLRNTYILYHNPPPILAKPKVPVVSVLGGLGSRIDELCEKVVGRLRGVVHISTCSMLKTRMTIEGFYRVTSVPACAVVDSVLQAMSMVQSENALIVAGFPRNRGDIEEYRSRRVRMDGVVLVDFEEEALRRFLKNEVSCGAVRGSDVESELERYKQDIISVAEYYDEKELLTVVMGDQDTDEMIEDMVMAVDKIIETRKHLQEEEATSETKNHDCSTDLIPTPNSVERPSTVEIREATEEDIRSIEAESRNSKEDEMEVEVKNSQDDIPKDEKTEQDSKSISESDVSLESVKETLVGGVATEIEDQVLKDSLQEIEKESPAIPILFAFENIKIDQENLKDLIVNDIGMCYINFAELVRSDGEKDDRLGTEESLQLLQSVLQRDSVSYSSGFFISDFPFDLLKENKFENVFKLGDVSFVCKIKEKSFETEVAEGAQQEKILFESPMSERVRIIFVTESNILDELKTTLQEIVSNRENAREGNSIEETKEAEKDVKDSEEAEKIDLEEKSDVAIDEGEKTERGNNVEGNNEEKGESLSPIDKVIDDKKEDSSGNIDKLENGVGLVEGNVDDGNQESIKDDKTSRDENEDSTCQDIDDLITDDTLNEEVKPDDSSQTEENKDASLKDAEIEDTLSQVSEEAIVPVEMYKEKAVLARQQNLDLETSPSESSTKVVEELEKDEADGEKNVDEETPNSQTKLIRQATFLSTHEPPQEASEPQENSIDKVEDSITNPEDVSEKQASDEIKIEDAGNPAEESQSEISGAIESENKVIPAPTEDNTTTENNGNQDNVESPSSTDNLSIKGDDTVLENQPETNNDNQDDVESRSSNDNVSIKGEDTVPGNQPTDIVENNSEEEIIDSSDIKEAPETSEKETDQEVQENSEVGSQIDIQTPSEKELKEEVGDEIEIKNVDLSTEEECLKSDTKSENEDNCTPAETKPDSEVDDDSNTPAEELEESIAEKDKPDFAEATESTEKTEQSDETQEEKLQTVAEEKENDETDPVSEKDQSGEGNSEEEISIPAEAEISKPDDAKDNTEPSDSNTISDESKEDQNSEPNSQIEVCKPETENGEEDCENSKENGADVTNEDPKESKDEESTAVADESANEGNKDNQEPSSTAEIETTDMKSEDKITEIPKAVDNDSDSNDENGDRSITIETQAEVHAPDSESPPLIPANNDGISENPPAESEAEENSAEKPDNEENIEEEMDVCIGDEAPDDVQLETGTLKETISENTDESQITTIKEMEVLGNERYSGKIQERNGSGILDQSRQEDNIGSEEQQERSSSSSRGEL